MVLLVIVFAVLSAAFAAEAARLTLILRVASRQLAESQSRLTPPPPPAPPSPLRHFECRREQSGLLWFPTLTAKDEERLVVGVSSGLPHCPDCVQPLKVNLGMKEEWTCAGCGAAHPASSADLRTTDKVLTDCLGEFFARHPDFAPAPGLSAPAARPAVKA